MNAISKSDASDPVTKPIYESIAMTIQPAVITPVLGTGLLATTYKGLSRRLHEKLRDGEWALAIDFANTHIVTMRRHDPKFAILSKCIDITVPDGMPTFSAAMPS